MMTKPTNRKQNILCCLPWRLGTLASWRYMHCRTTLKLIEEAND